MLFLYPVNFFFSKLLINNTLRFQKWAYNFKYIDDIQTFFFFMKTLKIIQDTLKQMVIQSINWNEPLQKQKFRNLSLMIGCNSV